jgi:hypothetical protein
VTPLQQRMSEELQLRGLAPATQQAYLRYVEQLTAFTGKSPDQATDEDFRQFFLALHRVRGLSRSTATVAIAAFKFLFEVTLQRPWPRLDLFRPVRVRLCPLCSASKKFGTFSTTSTVPPTTPVSPPSIPVVYASAKASTFRSPGSIAPACSSRCAAARVTRTATFRFLPARSPCSVANGCPIATPSGCFPLEYALE